MANKKSSRLALIQELARSKIDALPDLKNDVKDPWGNPSNYEKEVKQEQQILDHYRIPSGWDIEDPEKIEIPVSTSEAIAQEYIASSLNTLPEGTLERGHLAPVNQTFCSLHKLSKLLELEVVDQKLFNGSRAGFFRTKSFWGRSWHLYYVWPMNAIDPIIVIAECQFRDFMNRILQSFPDSAILSDPNLDFLSNTKMQTYRDVDLLIDFPDHPRFTPRYLGLSHSVVNYTSLLRQVPSKDFRTMAEQADPSLDEDDIITFNAITRGQFNADVESINASAAKEKADHIAKKKKAKKEAQTAKKKAMNEMFKRSQQYLGMRPASEEPPILPRIDPCAPVPFPPVSPLVLICFDVESWERNHNVITEVGLAIFSSSSLTTTPAPGTSASSWHRLIEAQHYRIAEHSMHQNSQFITGNAYGFKFGESQEVSIADCSLIIEEMFDVYSAEAKIVLVGHAVAGDIQYLDRLGFNPARHAAVIDTLDTQSLWKALNAHGQGMDNVGLARLLAELELDYGGLHNAGNDAVYTMRALLAMMVLEGTLRAGA